MRIDSGLVILLAIVAALVIVALALLFYSPGLLDLCAAIFATTFPTATDVFLHSVYIGLTPYRPPGTISTKPLRLLLFWKTLG